MLKEVRIGKIVATHGLRGEVKVLPTTDDISRFKELKSVILRKTSRGMRSENAGGGNGDQKKAKPACPAGGSLCQNSERPKPTENGRRVLNVTQIRFQNGTVLMRLEGVNSIDDARLLRNSDLLVDRADAIPLEEGEYFIGDYIGLRVVTDEGKEMGFIREVIETGANNVFLAVTEEGRELMLPNIPDCVLEARPEEGYIRVHILEGLLDL